MKTSSHSVHAFQSVSPQSPRVTRTLVVTVAAVFLLCGAAVAQSKGSSGNSTGRGSTNTRIPTTPDLSIQPTFIVGKVMMDGGAALPEPVAIERLCNGSVRREGYTDFKGHFQIQLGTNFGYQDASENDPRTSASQMQRPSGQSGTRSPVNLTGCEFRAVLAGFQSSTVMLHTVSDGFQMELGTITLKREAWTLPATLPLGDQDVVPLNAGETIHWKMV